jgi:hypothetical protein|tara:strand:+ start:3284 stop:3868 length:585 start_codon:yes stop_codon:yes gene_type:complete
MFNFFLLFIILINPFQKIFPTNWVLKKDINQIKVYLRNIDQNNQEYIAETIVNSNIKSISSIILDYNTSYQWMYKLESSKVLSNESDSLMYVYFTVNMNWPLKKRDLVSNVIISKKHNKTIIELNSKPDHIEINSDYERIEDTRSVWVLEFLEENKTKVSLRSYAVIEGIPTFISDLFILESPMYSLNKLKNFF